MYTHQHNATRYNIANYERVRLTTAPTQSQVPSSSTSPSQEPTSGPTHSPTGSRVPSIAPTISEPPTGEPSEWPTFDNGAMLDYDRLDTRSTTAFYLVDG